MPKGYSSSSSISLLRANSPPISLPSSFSTVQRYPQKSMSARPAVNVTRLASRTNPGNIESVASDCACEWNIYIQNTSPAEARTCRPARVSQRDCAVSSVWSSSANREELELDVDCVEDDFPLDFMLVGPEGSINVRSPAKINCIRAYTRRESASRAKSSRSDAEPLTAGVGDCARVGFCSKAGGRKAPVSGPAFEGGWPDA